MHWKPVAFALALAFSAVLAGCSQDVPTAPEADEGIALQPFLTGFQQPVFVAQPRGESSRLFIVEQTGAVKVWNGNTASTYLDLSSLVRSGGERGLLGLAFHPNFTQNGRLFVYYTGMDGDVTIDEYHAEPEADHADPQPVRGSPLLTIEHSRNSNHNGGMLAFGPDGMLYAGVGDGGAAGDPPNNAQNLDALLGKILRLDVDHSVGPIPYLIPTDNPFATRTRGAEVWDYGLRNPWRFSFDRATGDLWIGDVGQDRYEEVDREPAGSAGGVNYGWSRYEGEHLYDDSRDADHAVAPVAEYDHDGGHCSITGGYVYRGSALPSLQGAYLFADYCSGVVWSLRAASNGTGWTVRRILDTTHNISSFGEDQAGELYVVDHAGSVLKVVAA